METSFSSRIFIGIAEHTPLGDDLQPAGGWAAPAGYQGWLGDRTIRYMQRHGMSATALRSAVRRLLQEAPPRLPAPDHVYRELGRPVPRQTFLSCLKIVALLRPGVLVLKTRRLVLVAGVVKV